MLIFGWGWFTILPLNLTWPDDGLSSPAIIRNNVDLPQPLGPTMHRNSPSSIWKLILSRAVRECGGIPLNLRTLGKSRVTPRHAVHLCCLVLLGRHERLAVKEMTNPTAMIAAPAAGSEW